MTELLSVKPNWGVNSDIRALTTTRGYSGGDKPYATHNYGLHVNDDAAQVAQNRKQLMSELELPSEPLWLNQVHGTRVVKAQDVESGSTPEADGAWTDQSGVVLAIMSADCLPIFLSTTNSVEQGGRLALLHAGWRGLAGGVVDAGINALETDVENIRIALGPAIGSSAYEVGPEVREAFSHVDGASECFAASSRPGHFYANLYGLAARIAINAGIHAPQLPDHCTHTHAERWFSFRRQGACGRMVSLLWRQGSP